ncbi:MAG TPA: ABC transporter substrate-binding protein [Solirubrobacteraceae bacterium]|jgi:peptide/nickel transport system substrate-binding protein|nr:ABC transporter substrate-binding protein [Solirubrobacteraceae bacterium]
MSRDNRELDRLRSGRTELENHYIDELVSGSLSRRDFLRRGSMIGMSAPLLGAILAACGSSSKSTASGTGTSSAPVTRGGTLRVAAVTPAAAINPLTISDAGGLLMLNQTGEFLIFDSNLKLELQPMLALSWSPNADGSVWTFKLRPNVKFSNGAAMTADDVVYTFKQLSDPKNASNALSAFLGVLTPAGVQKVDSMTVAFHLEAPNGNFPYLVSSDNYNAIIVPANTDFSKWQTTFIGTGAFKMAGYTTNVGANFVPNVNYWGTKPLLDSTSFKFYSSQAPMILALQGNDVDVIAQFTPAGAAAILNSPSYKIIKLKSANHRELSMRNDQAPFTDPRVRQAVAYTLDRPGAVAALLSGDGTVANDYPFGPRYPSTDTSVPQRTQNISMAKQLLAAAGHPNGIGPITMNSEIYQEIPQLAQVIQQDAAKAGITIKLNITNQTLYYGKTFGSSPWLDGTMSLVDYGDRGAPNVYLTAPLTSAGKWNAARFRNKTYDSLVKQYVAALDLQAQKQVAGKIENLLLQETPIVYPYWIDGLTASTPNVGGLNPTSIAQLYLNNAYKSA